MTDVEGQKRCLRALMRSQLRQISSSHWQERSAQVSARLQELLNIQLHFNPHNEYLGVFSPLGDEVRWQQNWEVRSLSMVKLAFPGVNQQGTMVFQCAKWDELVAQQQFGGAIIAGPPVWAPQVLPRICIIPGLAFSANGKRLGRGKGFYDRYLVSHQCIKVGVCLEEFCLSDLPILAHDQNMDWVVTDRNVFQVSSYLAAKKARE